jgi:hypothetical protein
MKPIHLVRIDKWSPVATFTTSPGLYIQSHSISGLSNHKKPHIATLDRSLQNYFDSLSNQTMTPSMKMATIVVALFFLACAHAGSATEEAVAVEDMVPVSAAEHVTVAMPSGSVGTMLAAPVCLQCRCCPKSNPAQCVVTNCCSTFNCNPAGKCNVVQQKCGCGGCGGAN